MKKSVITTIKNEKQSIDVFLASLFMQSLPPDEVVIVDGGSTDGTIEAINKFKSQGYPVNLIVEPNANIAEGRNIAIQYAVNDIIAVTDAGCRLDTNWLELITEPFKDPGTCVVSGFTISDPKNVFEQYAALFSYPKLEDINTETFLPSSRSIAFRRDAWSKVGGYPERFYTAEDTLFDLLLKEAGYDFVFVPEAKVYWRPRSSVLKFFKQMFLYQKGDTLANISNPNIQGLIIKSAIKLLIALGMVAIAVVFSWTWLLVFALVVKYFYPGVKRGYQETKSWRAIIYMPILQTIVLVAVASGLTLGKIELWRNPGLVSERHTRS